MSKPAHDIFISYSTRDQKVVDGLSAYLEQNGIRCFVAYRDIPNGIVWAKAVTEAIESCKLMVVVFSENFNASKQVDREIEMCIEEGKPILTFKIENTDFKGVKKYFLKNLNWIDAFPNPEKCFGKLYDNVLRLLPETGTKPAPEQIPLQIVEGVDGEAGRGSLKENLRHSERSEESRELRNSTAGGRGSLKENNNLNKKTLWLIICVAVITIIASVLFFVNYKSNKSLENSAITEKTTNNEPLPQDTTSNKTDTAIQVIKKTEPKKESNKPVVTPPDSEKKDKANQKIEYIERTYTEPTMLTSTTGEQFEAAAGDTFKGEIEKATGKIVQGKIVDENKTVKRIFLLKRNQ